MLKILPVSLIAGRLVLGPVLLWSAAAGRTGYWFAAGLLAGLLSDILDGILARRFGSESPRMREWDSRVDMLFVLFVVLSAVVARGGLLLQVAGPVGVLIGLLALSILIPWTRFKRPPSFHAYSAKLAGLALFPAALELFLAARTGIFFWLAYAAAAASHIDRLLIGWLLPDWRTDVNGFWVLLDGRKDAKLDKNT